MLIICIVYTTFSIIQPLFCKKSKKNAIFLRNNLTNDILFAILNIDKVNQIKTFVYTNAKTLNRKGVKK